MIEGMTVREDATPLSYPSLRAAELTDQRFFGSERGRFDRPERNLRALCGRFCAEAR